MQVTGVNTAAGVGHAGGVGRRADHSRRRPSGLIATAIIALGFAGAMGAAPAASAAATLPGTWPRGIDVSSWQHPGGNPVDWSAVRRSGVRFAVIKATEGTFYTNPYFATDRHRAWAAGIGVGGYHYARPAWPASTAVDQANYFLRQLGDTRGTLQLAPILDLEATGGLSAARLTIWVRTFLETVETRTGRAPLLYTYPAYWNNIMNNSSAFMRYPLWVASYTGGPGPGALPGGWPKWMLWQYTPAGRVSGIVGTVDLDVYCCTMVSFPAAIDGRPSELWKRYAASASLRALLGTPVQVELPARGGGRWRTFRHGILFWSVNTGAHEVHGGIAAKYVALGGSGGLLGPPVSDEGATTAPGGRQSIFRGGRIYWSRATGAHEVHGGILAGYLALGGSASSLGLPVTDEYAVPGGRENAFQHGRLRWDALTRKVTLTTSPAP
jgi:lysozyme